MFLQYATGSLNGSHSVMRAVSLPSRSISSKIWKSSQASFESLESELSCAEVMPLRASSCSPASMACRRLIVIGLGNDGGHGLARGFAQNAGGLSGGITINLAAGRIFAGHRDARQLQGAGVGHGDVSIHAFEENGMVAGDFIDVPAAGEFFHRPQSLVPAAAHDPFVRRGVLHPRPNSIAKFSQRLHSRSGQPSAAENRRWPGAYGHR